MDNRVDNSPASSKDLCVHLFYNGKNSCSVMEAAAIARILKGWDSSSRFHSPFPVVGQLCRAEYGPYRGFADYTGQSPYIFACICSLDTLLHIFVRLATEVLGCALGNALAW